MRELEASELQAEWRHVLDDVERGETIIVLRDGRRVARIVPAADQRRERVESAIREIKAFRRTMPRLTLEEIQAWRHEGHKY